MYFTVYSILRSSVQFNSVQLLSHVRPFETPWTAACHASRSITNSWSLLKLMSIESVMPTNYLILCHPLLLLPWIFPSTSVFSNALVLCIRWPNSKIGVSASASVLPVTDSGLISFRFDWFDLLGSPRDSQESSPTPQFKSINSLALSFLHDPTLTIHDCLKNHSFDHTDSCQQSNVSAF